MTAQEVPWVNFLPLAMCSFPWVDSWEMKKSTQFNEENKEKKNSIKGRIENRKNAR